MRPSLEPGPGCRAGREKMKMNSHLVDFLALRASGRQLWVWQANGPELALWREEQYNGGPLTLTVERGKGEMGNLQVSLRALFSFP